MHDVSALMLMCCLNHSPHPSNKYNPLNIQIDCADEELLEAITQSAIQRGKIVLQKVTSNVKPELSAGTSFYHANSSSGDSSESNTSSFNEQNGTTLQKPQQMMQQVGGVASHKKPVLTLEPHYILKPLRLTVKPVSLALNVWAF